jgi:sulfate adenylyltransferase subunit 2
MLYSIGKDSMVMVHLARKAFFPARPPFALLHIDTGWKFREMIVFRDATARRLGLDLLVHANEEGRALGISPITSGSALHTEVMKTEALKPALDRYAFDAAFGGVRRDQERSRAKEHFSVRSAEHGWNPKNQRPELWRLFSTRLRDWVSMRVFPMSNWTEHDFWEYIAAEETDGCRSISPRCGRWSDAVASGSWTTTSVCR